MPDINLSPIYAAPADRDRDGHRAVQYWVLNPYGHDAQGELVNAIAKEHAAHKRYERTFAVALVTVGIIGAWVITANPAHLDARLAGLSMAGGVLGALLVCLWSPRRVRVAAEQDVARAVYHRDQFALQPRQIQTLTNEGFCSEAHEVLWAALCARDAVDDLDSAITAAPRADQDVMTAARSRHWQLRDAQDAAYCKFEELIAKAQTDPNATAALRAALDRVRA